MPVLENPKHEAFAVGVATGLSLARAYTNAGYSPHGARQHAHRLMVTNADVSLRVQELRIQMSKEITAGIVTREIGKRNARLAELQARWDQVRDQLDCIQDERGAALAAEAPGGSTGLLRKDYKGKDGSVAVYRIDPGMIELHRLLLEYEKRAAEELNQWGNARYIEEDDEEQPDLSKLTDEELKLWLRLYDKALPPKPSHNK